MFNSKSQVSSRPAELVSVNSFLQRVYFIMSAGLAITGVMSWFFYTMIQHPEYGVKPEWAFLMQSPTIWIVSFAPLVFVFLISGLINRISYSLATLLFAIYSLVMGISLSFIFLVYTTESVASTFFISGATFGAMAIIGMTTKMDLTRMGSFLMMALIGIIIASIVNIFLGSGLMEMIISGIGVLVFCGLTAYDTQKLMHIGNSIDADSETGRKAAVMGALTLYLDFINLFLFLLRFLGNRKD